VGGACKQKPGGANMTSIDPKEYENFELNLAKPDLTSLASGEYTLYEDRSIS